MMIIYNIENLRALRFRFKRILDPPQWFPFYTVPQVFYLLDPFLWFLIMGVAWRRYMPNVTLSHHLQPLNLGRITSPAIRIHYNDVIMGAMTSQITSFTIIYSTVYSSADQRKHQSSTSLAFVRGIHRWLVNSPHKGPVTRKMFPFDDVIMTRWL